MNPYIVLGCLFFHCRFRSYLLLGVFNTFIFLCHLYYLFKDCLNPGTFSPLRITILISLRKQFTSCYFRCGAKHTNGNLYLVLRFQGKYEISIKIYFRAFVAFIFRFLKSVRMFQKRGSPKTQVASHFV